MAATRSRSMSRCLRLVAPLFRSRLPMGTSTPQWAAAWVMSSSRRRVAPRGIDPGWIVGATASASRTDAATALAKGGGTELPICRATVPLGHVKAEPVRKAVKARHFADGDAAVVAVVDRPGAGKGAAR